MPGFEIYGPVIDPYTVKRAVQDTLKAWVPSHLAIQADRYGLPADTFGQPASWPDAISDFNTAADPGQLPSIVVVQGGRDANPRRDHNGTWTMSWPFMVLCCVAASSELDAEKLGSVHLAAIISALVQNGTLGGLARKTIPTGPDRYVIGELPGEHAQYGTRAVFSTVFTVEVPNVVSDMAGPDTPPDDPYHPPAVPEPFIDADITVASVPLEDTP